MESTSLSLPSVFDTGTTGLYHLKRFWAKSIARRNGLLGQDAFSDEWTMDTAVLDAAGVGLEQTLVYLFQHNVTFVDFENWILQTGRPTQETVARFNAELRATADRTADTPPVDEAPLSADDLAFWEEHGYFIIRNAVPRDHCRAAEQAVWDFLGMDADDSSTWYQPHPARQGIMVQFFQHPALQANRDNARIRAVYEQLWGTRRLWVSTDRVSFNPPENDRWLFPGPHLHWDVSLELPIPFGLQGLLYLTDTEATQGAFTLVPGFHRRIDEWLHSLPPNAAPRMENIEALGAVPIAAGAGDFILWHHALPHGSRPNTSTRPRIVQYINWRPVHRDDRQTWQ